MKLTILEILLPLLDMRRMQSNLVVRNLSFGSLGQVPKFGNTEVCHRPWTSCSQSLLFLSVRYTLKQMLSKIYYTRKNVALSNKPPE